MSKINSLGVYENKSQSFQNQRKEINFGNSEKNSQNKEGKKSLSVKTITNVAGVVLGVGSVSAVLLSKSLRPKDVKVFEKQTKKIKAVQDSINNLRDNVTIDRSKMNANFKAGLLFDKIASQNKELFNNLLYGFGTVVIMPLVILFAPFGKKKSTPEDRMAAVLRQPLSFATMFSMQLTIDKVFKDLVPKLVKKNSFEENIKDESGKMIYENIKFNSGAYKPHLVEELQKVAGLSSEKVSTVLKNADIDSITKELSQCCTKEKIDAVMPKVQKYLKINGKEQLLGQSIVILSNVLFSAPVGCTLLNVLYGKSMKALDAKKALDKAKENSIKGGQA